MKPYDDGQVMIYCGSSLAMSEVPDESVQCVPTSPPYWGLRKYSGEQEMVWGDNHCEHEWGDLIPHPMEKSGKHGPMSVIGAKDAQHEVRKESNQGQFCTLCSAWRGAYGLEPTPEMYVEHTIMFLREIRRVLRKDGVVFWNIGDSYMGSWGDSGHRPERDGVEGSQRVKNTTWFEREGHPKENPPTSRRHAVLKPKDLCLIPFDVAKAAQGDGWWVRSVIIWDKDNPMPESVTDRPTESHEYILMLVKNGADPIFWTHRDLSGTRERPKPDYRYINRITEEEVAEAPFDWKEKITCPDCEATGYIVRHIGWYLDRVKCPTCNGKGETRLWQRINLWKGHAYYWDADAVREPQTGGAHSRGTEARNEAYQEARGSYYGFKSPILDLPTGRNIRTVWEFPTQPCPEAHFAVFPEELPEKCILAATPPKCCSECGAPWMRVSEHKPLALSGSGKAGRTIEDLATTGKWQGIHAGKLKRGPACEVTALGWRPTCSCNADTKPSIVLDPFMGAGTTLWVAKKLGRHAIGYDISEDYCNLAVERNRQMVMELGVT